MLLETVASHVRKARSVNQTSTSFVSKVPTLATPSGDAGTATGASVIDLSTGGVISQNFVKIMPYGEGSNNNTFSMRVIGWHSIINGTNAANPREWFPTILAEILCTISTTCPGVTDGTVSATEYFADTLVVTYPTTPDTGIVIKSNGADLIAIAAVDMMGSQKLELSFSTGSSATSCNALVSMY